MASLLRPGARQCENARVTWTNQDNAPHTATANDGSFDSGRLDHGQSYSQTFDAPGAFAYHCTFHPNMHGTITVS